MHFHSVTTSGFADMFYSAVVPGNLPSQLEMLSTAQTYYLNMVLLLNVNKLILNQHPELGQLRN